ncbi:hypothetical protein SDC9_180762 [bioreactor metagenome]|uniref:Uncharacterized protein n=1 Tax=bioreactor metagenome TaxID=1076179 RepID=A0A645H2N2_9ZZZZ
MHRPVVLSQAKHLQALGVNDVDMADKIGPVAVGALDFDATVCVLADMPVQQQFFPIIFVKLNQADVTHDRNSGLE